MGWGLQISLLQRTSYFTISTLTMTTLHETITPPQRQKRITVLISGSGSNLQALIDAAGTPRLPNAAITFVLSSRSNAYGLTRAKQHGIPTSVSALKTFLNRNPGATREDYDAEVARQVIDSHPDLVVLAGWMHILSDSFLEILNGETQPPSAPALPPPGLSDPPAEPTPFPRTAQSFPIPCINLHPALPGAFDGANAIGRAFEAYQKGEIKHTGVMVHRVVVEVDRGEPLVVRDVEIKPDDTLETLEARIHEASKNQRF